MSKIGKAFENGKALIVFVTCGDPDPETTASVVRAAAANGADLIELGIPFSDPTAEGPVRQSANLRALHGGITTDKVFSLVRSLRSDVTIPMVFTTYANVVFSYGAERFLSKCRECGIDGLIVPDLPFEEKEEFWPFCRKYGVDLISMVTLTSKRRVSMIASQAEGFLYIVSGSETMDNQSKIAAELASVVSLARESTDIPCAISCGSYAPGQLKNMAELADGVISESSIVQLLEKYGREAPKYIGEYVRAMKNAMQA